MKTTRTLAQLAELVKGTVVGNPETEITGIAAIDEASPGDITFIANPRYRHFARTTKASALIVGESFPEVSTNLIRVANPDWAFTLVAEVFAPAPLQLPVGIDKRAVIGKNVSVGVDVSISALSVVEEGTRIGDRTVIYPQVYIGHESSIGSDCLIYPQVMLRERTHIGDRVIIHSGTVIGTDGFGYVTIEGEHRKIPQRGMVQIDDDVEIGAGVCIDRARFGKTHIKKGTKIDNLVQIAHNVVVGEHSFIVGQSGVAGSTTLGSHVILAPQSGVVPHVKIGDNVIVGARAGVTRDIAPGKVVSGSPAWEHAKELKVQALVRRLPELAKTIKQLHERIAQLESSAKDHQE